MLRHRRSGGVADSASAPVLKYSARALGAGTIGPGRRRLGRLLGGIGLADRLGRRKLLDLIDADSLLTRHDLGEDSRSIGGQPVLKLEEYRSHGLQGDSRPATMQRGA